MAGEKVLVIEDDRLQSNILQTVLSSAGYDVTQAEGGEQGVAIACASPPDLVITDMHMPGLSGRQVCERLKASDATRMVPIIMFTGSETADKVEQLDAGADDYLAKSGDFRELQAKVRVFLRIKHLQDQVMVQNEKLRRELEANERELAMARDLQLGLLPRSAGVKGGLSVAFRYIPTHWVGGDLFDVMEEADGATSLFVSDVSGHGVSSAFVTAMMKSSVLAYSRESQSVRDLVARVNSSIVNLLRADMFVTAFFARLSTGGDRVDYVNAGHPPAMVVRRHGGGVAFLESTAAPLGIVDDVAFSSKSTDVGPGDLLVLYTDGIIEGTNAAGKQFGVSAFVRSVLSRSAMAPEDLADGVIEDLVAFSGTDTFADDVNLVVCEVRGE